MKNENVTIVNPIILARYVDELSFDERGALERLNRGERFEPIYSLLAILLALACILFLFWIYGGDVGKIITGMMSLSLLMFIPISLIKTSKFRNHVHQKFFQLHMNVLEMESRFDIEDSVSQSTDVMVGKIRKNLEDDALSVLLSEYGFAELKKNLEMNPLTEMYVGGNAEWLKGKKIMVTYERDRVNSSLNLAKAVFGECIDGGQGVGPFYMAAEKKLKVSPPIRSKS